MQRSERAGESLIGAEKGLNSRIGRDRLRLSSRFSVYARVYRIRFITCVRQEHHQALRQKCPVPLAPNSNSGPVARRAVVEGITYDCYREAA